jgi:hypothetical protein
MATLTEAQAKERALILQALADYRKASRVLEPYVQRIAELRKAHVHVWDSDPKFPEGARCIVCDESARQWYCPKSPDHLCHYDKGDFDQCDYCGQPEERQ